MGCTERIPIDPTVRPAKSVWTRPRDRTVSHLRKAAVMPNGKWLLTALILAISTLFLAVACGGDGEESGVATPTAGGSPTTSAITNELEALGEQWEQTMSKVVYNVTSTSDGTTDESSLTLYWRPPDWRMDVSSSEGDVTMIATSTALYWCGAESGANQCFSYDPSEFDASATLEVFDPTATGLNFSGQDVDRSEQTVFGEPATCFSVTRTTEESTTESEWCFASDGILLQFAGTSDDPASGNLTIEATNVNRNVTEADFDFEPPYAVTPYVLSASPTPSEAPASPTPSGTPASPTPVQ
jgi:outer membrane lipoprotein-sorting protein